MASNLDKFQPIKNCEICGKCDLMTDQSLEQHVTDKEDIYHKRRDPYPDVCACGRKFMTSQKMATHEVGECNLNLDMLYLEEVESEEVGAKDNLICAELKKNLDQYFEGHVKMNAREMKWAKAAAKKVTDHLLKNLRNFMGPLALCDAEPVGSSFDGLKVAPADEFDMLIPIELNEIDWDIVDAKTAVVEGRTLNAPGFWLLKKKSSRETNMDAYLRHTQDGDYVVPGNIIKAVQPKIHRIIRKIEFPRGIDDVSAGVKRGLSVYMQVKYNYWPVGVKKFDLDFVLEVRVGNAPDAPKLVAKQHPSVTQEEFYGVGEDSAMALLWQESSAKKESEKIRGISEEGPKDCRKKCWKLVKALAMKNKHLGSLCTYFYKTLFLHLLDNIPDNADWYDAKLADRFLDVFKKMEKVLHRKWMPLYYTRDVNMLLPRYNEMQVENVYYYVRKMNVEGSHMQLLYGGPSSAVKKKEKEYTVFSKLRKVKAPAVKAAAQPNKTTNPKPRKRKSAPPKKRPAKPASKKPAKAKAPKAQVRPTFVDLDFEIDLDMDDFGADYDDYNDYGGYGGYQDDFF